MVHNFNRYINIGVNRDMNTLEKTPDAGLKNMVITVAFIFSVLTALIIISFYFAGALS